MTEGRCNDLSLLSVITEINLLEVRKHILLGNIGSQKGVDALRLERNANRLFFLRVNVYHAADYLTRAQLLDQLAGTVDGILRIVGIQALLELTGSVRTETDAFCRETDVGAIEAGCLKHHGLDVVCDHGVFSTHDTCDTNSFLTVADHQHVLIHGALLTIQGYEFLVSSGPADNDLMACQGVIIISVHRLAVLFHHIVGDINDVVDRTDSVGSQSSLHPYGRGSDLDIFYDSRAVTRAEVGILYDNFHIVVNVFAVSGSGDNGRFELFVEGSCCLTGNTDDAVAVHTVGSDLILENHVIQAKSLDCALSYHCILRKNVNAVLRSFRIHISAGTQFLDGAHHTVGLDAAEFSFFDGDAARSLLSVMASCHTAAVQHNRNLVAHMNVGSAGNDLNRLLADIYLADDELIRIRMTLDGKDLSDDDLVQVCVQFFKSFHFGTGQCHGVGVFLRCHVQPRYICLNPGK